MKGTSSQKGYSVRVIYKWLFLATLLPFASGCGSPIGDSKSSQNSLGNTPNNTAQPDPTSNETMEEETAETPFPSEPPPSNDSEGDTETQPLPDPPPQISECGTMNSEACAVMKIVNEDRMAFNLSPLGISENCVLEAQYHAEDMAQQGFFSHDNPITGESTAERFARFEIGGSWGENIALAQRTPEAVMTAWMNSPGHRANILNPNFQSMGVGFYENYWVQCFSSRTPK